MTKTKKPREWFLELDRSGNLVGFASKDERASKEDLFCSDSINGFNGVEIVTVQEFIPSKDTELEQLKAENEQLRMANHILTDHRMRSVCLDFYALDDEAKQIIITTMHYMIKQYAKKAEVRE